MLPNVEAHQGLHAVAQRIAGVLLADDRQLARLVLREPYPARTEQPCGGFLHLGLQLVERSEIFVDGLLQRARGTGLRLGRKFVEEEFVVPHLRGVVEDRAVGRNDDILQRLLGIGGIDNQFVEFIHVSHVMLVVVKAQRLFGDLRCERVISVRQVLRSEAHLFCSVCCHKR